MPTCIYTPLTKLRHMDVLSAVCIHSTAGGQWARPTWWDSSVGSLLAESQQVEGTDEPVQVILFNWKVSPVCMRLHFLAPPPKKIFCRWGSMSTITVSCPCGFSSYSSSSFALLLLLNHFSVQLLWQYTAHILDYSCLLHLQIENVHFFSFFFYRGSFPPSSPGDEFPAPAVSHSIILATLSIPLFRFY